MAADDKKIFCVLKDPEAMIEQRDQDKNDPITAEQVITVTPEKFWSKIKFGEPNECWEWQAALTKGYGQWKHYLNKQTFNYRSHRFVFMKFFGELSPKIEVLHKCDNPKCCNPNHLFAGTQEDNMKDMKLKKRSAKGSGHWNSKLTEDIVREIKRRLSQNEKGASVSKALGIPQYHISMIKVGRLWAHV